ncbi:hypothetical protein [Streptomyces sp. CBMA123]|uniref:hypothetical protein n=1 Tax=Streptomyces sp. CBMA123 TaxID=1896313 RepID=UPI001661CEFF|nr:hypothetical protein [Streptomyces sp. CBMA123]MBD0694593.1 hypothetical protein [Streptomyces sp. CBMA123]
MIVSETPEFHIGDQVWVYRESSYGTVESAVVVDAPADHSLRLEFADGHRNHLRHGRVELHAPAARTALTRRQDRSPTADRPVRPLSS